MKRTMLYSLAVVGIISLVGGIWWLLAQPTRGGYGPSFFISTSIFLLVFAVISLRWMHETAAALLGAAVVWLVHYIGGAATIIGDPPSTIVGSHLGLSFVDYLVNMAPIAILCMIPFLLIISFLYRRELAGAKEQFSSALITRLEADAQITDFPLLRKAGLVGLLMIILFFTGDYFGGIPPSVIALSGAAILVAWVRPDMHRMLHEVNWTTLIFFIGIFVIVGGLKATGVISWVAGIISDLAGDSLKMATILMVWIPGVASGIVDNIPFTVASMPIADFLTATIPGAENMVLYWALILGADLGGNATILGSAPNIVAVGLLSQAGYRLGFGRFFMRDGVPVAIATLLLATVWLLVRY